VHASGHHGNLISTAGLPRSCTRSRSRTSFGCWNPQRPRKPPRRSWCARTLRNKDPSTRSSRASSRLGSDPRNSTYPDCTHRPPKSANDNAKRLLEESSDAPTRPTPVGTRPGMPQHDKDERRQYATRHLDTSPRRMLRSGPRLKRRRLRRPPPRLSSGPATAIVRQTDRPARPPTTRRPYTRIEPRWRRQLPIEGRQRQAYWSAPVGTHDRARWHRHPRCQPSRCHARDPALALNVAQTRPDPAQIQPNEPPGPARSTANPALWHPRTRQPSITRTAPTSARHTCSAGTDLPPPRTQATSRATPAHPPPCRRHHTRHRPNRTPHAAPPPLACIRPPRATAKRPHQDPRQAPTPGSSILQRIAQRRLALRGGRGNCHPPPEL